MLRVITAFLVAPWLAWALRGAVSSSEFTNTNWQALAVGALQAAIPIYVFAVPIGLGVFTAAWFMGRIGLISAVIAGASVALLFFAEPTLGILADGRLNTWHKSKVLLDSAIEILFGAWVGTLVWLLGVWRNPALWLHRKQVLPSAKSAA